VRLRGEPGATFRSFRNRNYRLYISGILVSTVGTWSQIVAQDWLVLDITRGSGSALGITTALQFLSLLLLGPWGGVVADRYPKRLVLMVTAAAYGVLSLILGTLTVTGTVLLWHVYVLAFALGLVNVVDMPTRQSMVFELVKPADRVNAVALQGAAMASGRLIGPAIAGLLINIIGIGPVFMIGALLFSPVIVALLLMREDELYVPTRSKAIKGQLRATVAYLRGRRDLVLVLALVGFVAAFGMNQQITTALMTKNVYHLNAGAYGLASTLFAVGSLSGSLLAARLGRPTKRLMLITALLFGAVVVASALPPTYPLFVVLMPPTGLLVVICTTSTLVAVQIDVAPDIRGRIAGLYYLVFTGTKPFGSTAIGWAAQVFGARAGMFVSGLVTVLAALVIAPLLLRHERAKEPTSVAPFPEPEHRQSAACGSQHTTTARARDAR
jgi:MFS family permease